MNDETKGQNTRLPFSGRHARGTGRRADGASYDPVANLASQLTISTGSGPEVPADFTSHGSYSVIIDGVSYNTTLSTRELAAALRALNVTVARLSCG